jgi:hypothetical protein
VCRPSAWGWINTACGWRAVSCRYELFLRVFLIVPLSLVSNKSLYKYRYIGDYKNGQKDGQGSCTYPNGSVHSGLYCNGVKSGMGTCTWANGNAFSGMYVNDRMHGTGRFQWASGHVYTGEFASDRRHGRGTLIFKNGRRQKGHWNKGDFVAESDWGAADVGTAE